MKANTPELMKFKRLQRRLGESRRGTIGLLESLWIEVSRNCPEGDIGRFTNEEIAIMVDWELDPDSLVEALVECRWLDKCDQHRLVVHDWCDHCPTYIKGGLAKKGKAILKANQLQAEPIPEEAIATSSELQAESIEDQAIATSPEVLSTYSILFKPIQEREKAGSATSSNPEESNPLPPSRHLSVEEFQSAWGRWKSKLAANNGRPIDSMTEHSQLYELESFDTAEAIAIVQFSTSRTKCNNLITNGDHRKAQIRPLASTQPRPDREFAPKSKAVQEFVRKQSGALAEAGK